VPTAPASAQQTQHKGYSLPRTGSARTLVTRPERRVTDSGETQPDRVGPGTHHPSPLPTNPGKAEKSLLKKRKQQNKTHLHRFTNRSTETEAGSPPSRGCFAAKPGRADRPRVSSDAGSSVIHLPSSPERLCRGRVSPVQISWWSGPAASLHTPDLPPHSWPGEQKQKAKSMAVPRRNLNGAGRANTALRRETCPRDPCRGKAESRASGGIGVPSPPAPQGAAKPGIGRSARRVEMGSRRGRRAVPKGLLRGQGCGGHTQTVLGAAMGAAGLTQGEGRRSGDGTL